MAAKLLNIEVGEKLTRVCAVSKKGRGAQVTNTFRFTTPEGSVTDGQIMKPDALATELRAQLSSNGVGDLKSVTFVLASTKIASREVLLPPVKENRLKAVVESNAHEYFPVDLSNYQVAHVLLENVKEPEPGARVLVTAVPKQIMLSYTKLAEMAGLTITGFDYTANSQYQLLTNIPVEGITMYANIGTNQTIITFLQNGKLLLLRTFPFGGDDTMREMLMGNSAANRGFTEILDLCENEAWVKEHVSVEAQNEAFSRLINGISRSADFFNSSHKGMQVDKVVLLGACSEIVGLCEAVQADIGKETVLLEAIDGIDKVANKKMVTLYATVIAATFASLDIMPPEMAASKRKGGKSATSGDSIALGLAIMVLGVAVGGYFTATSALKYFATETEIESTKNRIEELAYVKESYDMYVQYQQIEANLMIVEREGVNYNAEARAFIEELERKMPSSLLTLAATLTNEGIAMSVETASMGDAGTAIAQLRTFESVENVIVDSISEETDETGLTIVSFQIAASYPALVPIEVPEIATEQAADGTEEPTV